MRIPADPTYGRQISVQGMAYAPTSEQGVVFLFGRLAPQLGFTVEKIGTRCPDCLAKRRGRSCRIEFEYWASSYEVHGHKATACDYLVCWENDWETPPVKYRKIEIISLKDYVGATPRVFYIGCNESTGNQEELRASRVEWNLPTRAQIGDLILMYRSKPTSGIRDIWRVVGPFKVFGKRNREDRWPGLQGGLRRVATLKVPLTYQKLVSDPRTKNLAVVRKHFQGKGDVTDDWHLVHDRIVELNPGVKRALKPWIYE